MLLILALFWHVIIPGKENQLEKLDTELKAIIKDAAFLPTGKTVSPNWSRHSCCLLDTRTSKVHGCAPPPKKSLLGKAINYTLNQFTKKI